MAFLSETVRLLTANTDRSGRAAWLPLPVHLQDTAEIARKLWQNWAPEAIKREIASSVGGYNNALPLLVFLAIVHDIGKATPLFQSRCLSAMAVDAARELREAQESAGLYVKPIAEFMNQGKTPHSLASEAILSKAGLNASAAAIVGAHHGKPQDACPEDSNAEYGVNYHMSGDRKHSARHSASEA